MTDFAGEFVAQNFGMTVQFAEAVGLAAPFVLADPAFAYDTFAFARKSLLPYSPYFDHSYLCT